MPSTKTVLATFAILAVVLFAGIGNVGLFDVDEAIFAEASAEMLETGDFVTPTYNAEPRYHKPPFIYWVQAESMEIFGKTAFAARLPSAIFAFFTLLLFYTFLERLTANRRFALTATVILGLNTSFYLVAHAATADMALNFFILATTMAFIAMIYAKQAAPFAPFVGGLILAAAFLSKGPVALMVPCIVIGLITFVKPGIWHNFKRINPILALIALLLGIAPWLYLIIDAKGLDFFKEFWLVHNIGRFTEAMGNTQTTSKAYYIFVVMFGLFPWALLFPSALNWVRKGFIARLRSANVIEALPAVGLVWFLAVVVFFSFSQTKLPHYILPAYAGFALLIAGRLEDMWKNPPHMAQLIWMLPYILIFSLVFMLLPYAPDIALGNINNLPTSLQYIFAALNIEITPLSVQKAAIWQQNVHIPFAVKGIAISFAMGSIFGLWMIMNKMRQGVTVLALSTTISLLMMTNSLVPTAYALMQQHLATIGENIKENYIEGESQVYFVAIHQPSVRFVSGKPFTSIGHPNMLKPTKAHTFYVFKLENLPAMRQQLTPETYSEDCAGGYCLIEANKK